MKLLTLLRKLDKHQQEEWKQKIRAAKPALDLLLKLVNGKLAEIDSKLDSYEKYTIPGFQAFMFQLLGERKELKRLRSYLDITEANENDR